MTSEPESPAELLYRALNEPLGIIIETDNLERFRQRLYAERAKDEDLKCISISVSPTSPANQLWLIKKDPNSAEG